MYVLHPHGLRCERLGAYPLIFLKGVFQACFVMGVRFVIYLAIYIAFGHIFKGILAAMCMV